MSNYQVLYVENFIGIDRIVLLFFRNTVDNKSFSLNNKDPTNAKFSLTSYFPQTHSKLVTSSDKWALIYFSDFLLCHDDELESRRIAFILYLSKEWEASFGGLLDLFVSSEETEPLSIVKSVIPVFNKFVFFNVTSRSFHQVSEVVRKDARRLAISGWFYGKPLPRPNLNFELAQSYPLQEKLAHNQTLLKNYFTPEYLKASNYTAINASLEEFSVVKLKRFLQAEKYDDLCRQLDDSENKSELTWENNTKANLCSFLTPRITYDISLDNKPTVSSDLQNLINMFHSAAFFKFLEQVTEFQFLMGTNSTKIIPASLRRFQHGSYILLKPNVEHQDGNVREEEECEILDNESESENEGQVQVFDTETHAHEEEESSQTDGNEEEEDAASNESEEDEVEDNMEVDIIFYMGDFTWHESHGGQTVYADMSGQQLLKVTPEPNTLAIVARERDVCPYITYVNCTSGKERFHTITMTVSKFKDN